MDWYLMVWRKYAEFDGRSRRTEYWMFVLFNFLAMLALAAIGLRRNRDVAGQRMAVLFIPVGIYGLADSFHLWPSLRADSTTPARAAGCSCC